MDEFETVVLNLSTGLTDKARLVADENFIDIDDLFAEWIEDGIKLHEWRQQQRESIIEEFEKGELVELESFEVL